MPFHGLLDPLVCSIKELIDPVHMIVTRRQTTTSPDLSSQQRKKKKKQSWYQNLKEPIRYLALQRSSRLKIALVLPINNKIRSG